MSSWFTMFKRKEITKAYQNNEKKIKGTNLCKCLNFAKAKSADRTAARPSLPIIPRPTWASWIIARLRWRKRLLICSHYLKWDIYLFRWLSKFQYNESYVNIRLGSCKKVNLRKVWKNTVRGGCLILDYLTFKMSLMS